MSPHQNFGPVVASVPCNLSWHNELTIALPGLRISWRFSSILSFCEIKKWHSWFVIKQNVRIIFFVYKGIVVLLYELITQELPFLRRYARAMTGDQMTGDLYVEAMLQEHILTPRPVETPLPRDRVALFALLDSVIADPNALPKADKDLAVFAGMSSISRRALFLTAVEQFDRESAGKILGLSPEDLHAVLTEAERDLVAALATTVLIIEDEPMIAFQLKEIIESLGHTMAGRATTRDEAVELARQHKPGLLLVDIQLADGSSGLDAMDQISEFHSAPSIVITAYPGRLLAGRANEPAFLLPKPFRVDLVRAVISQALLTQART